MATILIVEDDRNMRLLTSARLADLYTVVTACDGIEALELIYKGGIDMVVADIMMPRMDGYVLLTRSPDNGSKIIGFYTNYYYTHASIGLDEDMDTFYSFVKKGFFVEKITKYIRNNREPFPCQLYELNIPQKKYDALKEILKNFESRKGNYRYSYIGVISALFHFPFVQKNKYFCSQFVAEMLHRIKAVCLRKNSALYFPCDFNKLPELSKVFEGNLMGYAQSFALHPYALVNPT